jgi:hypothetical protein
MMGIAADHDAVGLDPGAAAVQPQMLQADPFGRGPPDMSVHAPSPVRLLLLFPKRS